MLDFIESVLYASAVFVSMYCFWGAILVSKNYILATGIERRRVEEATHLLRAYCSTTEGASLSQVFAKCEDARLLLSDVNINKLRIFERTFTSFFETELKLTIAHVYNLVVVYAAVFLFFFINKKIVNVKFEREEYSLIAQHKRHTALLLDSKKKL
jgi:hypothetical protein